MSAFLPDAHASDHDGGHDGHTHDHADASDEECCMLHCIPLGHLKQDTVGHPRFVACLAEDVIMALCSVPVRGLLKPPRPNLS